MKYIILCIINLVGIKSIAQNYFEGKVHFERTYETLNPSVTNEQLEKFYGKWMIGVVQENRYMVIMPWNEIDSMKVYYFLESSLGYIETTDSDTITEFRIDSNPGELLSANFNEKRAIVLGDTCKSFRMEYVPEDSYVERIEAIYYYNEKYKLNPNYYENHKESFWNLFVDNTGSVSVRNEIINYPLYKSIYQAIEINEQEIDDDYFMLNSNKYVKRL